MHGGMELSGCPAIRRDHPLKHSPQYLGVGRESQVARQLPGFFFERRSETGYATGRACRYQSRCGYHLPTCCPRARCLSYPMRAATAVSSSEFVDGLFARSGRRATIWPVGKRDTRLAHRVRDSAEVQIASPRPSFAQTSNVTFVLLWRHHVETIVRALSNA
jgi:hypothetical protein